MTTDVAYTAVLLRLIGLPQNGQNWIAKRLTVDLHALAWGPVDRIAVGETGDDDGVAPQGDEAVKGSKGS